MSFANAIQNTEGFKKCFQGLQTSVRKLWKCIFFFKFYPWQVNNEGLNYAVGVNAIVRGVAPL